MDYNQISNFLDKFKKIIYQKEEKKEIIVKSISNIISHQIKKDSLKIKGSFIYINESPVLRSEILINKEKILNDLKKIIPESNFLDIK